MSLGYSSAAYMRRWVFIILALLLLVSIAMSPISGISAVGSESWRGEYWNLSEEEHISGLMPEREADFTRQDAEINFEWEDQSPDDSISADYFAARWTKSVYFEARSYDLETGHDDGMRITIGGETLYDDWAGEAGGSNDVYVSETAGYKQVVVEYREVTGWARAIVFMTALTTPPEATQLIGQENFTSSMANTITPTNYGFGSPEGIAVDTVNHRLFVSDDSYLVNRVLVFNLSNSNELVDKTADYVIGLSSMTVRDSNDCDITSATTLCEPAGLTIDETNNRLFVADKDNHRVLVYDLDSLENGMSASYVLGQSNFNEDDCNADDTPDDDVLCYPSDVDYDSTNDRLFVADEENSRILAFDVAPNEIENGMYATGVLGHSGFGSSSNDRGGSVAANSLDYPSSVHFDEGSSRLLVADEGNSRVLIYNLNDGFTNGEDAQTVLGQAGFTDECMNRCTDAGQNTLSEPSGVHYDSDMDMIFIADTGNNRVVVFDDKGDGLGDISNGENFDYVIGQSDFVSTDSNRGGDPTANGLDSPNTIITTPGTNRLLVTDNDNDRVLWYDVSSITNGEDAVDVMGQANMMTGLTFGIGIISPRGLSSPTDVVVDSENNRVFVADEQNARVLIYNTDSNGNLLDSNADNVLGQPDLYTGYDYNWVGCLDATQNNMCAPAGLALDTQNNRLFISDSELHRVLVYDVNPNTLQDGQNATHVLGQANFSKGAANSGDDASRDSLYRPHGLSYDASNRLLYIADTENSRVVAYNAGVDDIENGMDADRVIGQSDFTGQDCNRNDSVNENTLCYPRDLAVTEDGQKLYIADATNSRVVVHDIGNSFENGQTAAGVIGQSNLTSSYCDRGGSTAANGLCYPSDVALDEANDYVYISDNGNNRIVRYGAESYYDGTQSSGLVYGQMLPAQDGCNMGDVGNPSEYSLCEPEGIAVSPENGQLWVVDSDNNRVLGYGDVSGQPDADNDGIDDETENTGPNNGDANNDGVLDSGQPHVASFLNTINNHYIALQLNSDCTISSADTKSESAHATQDSGYVYNAGFLNFTADCGVSGYEATVRIYQYGVQEANLLLRKYNPNTNAYFSIKDAIVSTESYGAVVASYSVVDGGERDIDGVANGTIVDPVGLGSLIVGVPNTGLR